MKIIDRFLKITVTTILAGCAVFVMMQWLASDQIPLVQAAGCQGGIITHTTAAEFSQGDHVLSDTVVRSADGGEIRLAAYFEDYFEQ